MEIRIARVDDAGAITDIYAPYVRDTAISFEFDPPSASDMARRIERILKTHPWLVAEENGRIAGYAYAGPHRERAAYRWASDVAIYMHPDAKRCGVASALYARLFDILTMQNMHIAYAGVTLPNEASVGFHTAMGFSLVGVYREVGFKMGAWRDVGWWERSLGPAPASPEEPLAFAALKL